MRQTFLCILKFTAALTLILSLFVNPGESKKNGTAAVKKPKGTKASGLEIEDQCDSDDECESGYCCPSGNIPYVTDGKACRSQDCCAQLATINPEEHTFDFKNKNYKLFIKDWKNWLEAQVECCKWDNKNGRLAIVDTDEVYDRVESELTNVMKTMQRQNTGPNLEIMTDLEISVFVDGTDIDDEFNYVSRFAGVAFPRKYWSSKAKDSKDLNCVGLRYWDDGYGKYKMNTIKCNRLLPFLCEKTK